MSVDARQYSNNQTNKFDYTLFGKAIVDQEYQTIEKWKMEWLR